MKRGAHGPIGGYDMVQMAHAICDADPMLEDAKHGHRCVERSCLVPHDICVAWSQARAAIEALGLTWAPTPDLSAKRRKRARPPPAPPIAISAPAPVPEHPPGPHPDYRRNRMVGG